MRPGIETRRDHEGSASERHPYVVFKAENHDWFTRAVPGTLIPALACNYDFNIGLHRAGKHCKPFPNGTHPLGPPNGAAANLLQLIETCTNLDFKLFAVIPSETDIVGNWFEGLPYYAFQDPLLRLRHLGIIQSSKFHCSCEGAVHGEVCRGR